MNVYASSKKCCSGFADAFFKVTRREYNKSDKQLYSLLVNTGSEETAIQVSERRHKAYIDNGIKQPSKMNPCTTLYKLVKEIWQKAHIK